MTRLKKIKFLYEMAKQEITYHHRTTDNRLFVDSINLDGDWLHFSTDSKDQAAAGRIINLIYEEITKNDNLIAKSRGDFNA